jgi:FkbM family methyltransferase
MSDPSPFGTYAPTGFAQWAIQRSRSLPNDWTGRRIGKFLRHVGLRALRGKPVDVEAFGSRMRVYPYNNICEKKVLFTPQFFDPEEMALLKEIVRDGFTFLDVGANVGVYSLFVASLAGPRSRIIAVEPQPEIFDRLVYNISENPFGTIKAIACAVADKPGELTLFLHARNQGESSVKVLGNDGAFGVRVPATTLLDIIRQEKLTHVDAVKLDVEGAEDLILGSFFRDAPASLHPSLMVIEDGRHQWQMDLPGLLLENGYRLRQKTRLNIVFEKVAPASA